MCCVSTRETNAGVKDLQYFIVAPFREGTAGVVTRRI